MTIAMNTVDETRNKLIRINKGAEKAILEMKDGISPDQVCQFDYQLNTEWKYFENKFFNPETFERRIRDLNNGEYPYDELYEVIQEYVKLKVEYHALSEYINNLPDEEYY